MYPCGFGQPALGACGAPQTSSRALWRGCGFYKTQRFEFFFVQMQLRQFRLPCLHGTPAFVVAGRAFFCLSAVLPVASVGVDSPVGVHTGAHLVGAVGIDGGWACRCIMYVMLGGCQSLPSCPASLPELALFGNEKMTARQGGLQG